MSHSLSPSRSQILMAFCFLILVVCVLLTAFCPEARGQTNGTAITPIPPSAPPSNPVGIHIPVPTVTHPIVRPPAFPMSEVNKQTGFAFPILYDPSKIRLNIYLLSISLPDSIWAGASPLSDTFPVAVYRIRGGLTLQVDLIHLPMESAKVTLYSVKAGGPFIKGDTLIIAYMPFLFISEDRYGAISIPFASEIDNVSGDPTTIYPVRVRF